MVSAYLKVRNGGGLKFYDQVSCTLRASKVCAGVIVPKTKPKPNGKQNNSNR